MAGYPSLSWINNIHVSSTVQGVTNSQTRLSDKHFYTSCIEIFIYSFTVDEHLGYLHTLSIVYNAAMNTRVQIYPQDPAFFLSFSLHPPPHHVSLFLSSPKMRWLAQMVILLSIFGGISTQFFMVVVPIYFSTNSVEVPFSPHLHYHLLSLAILMIAILTEEPSLMAQMVKNLRAMQETWV